MSVINDYHGFDVKELSKCMSNLPNHLKIVSVGCGHGYFEMAFLKQYPSFQIIAVDPNPDSFNKDKVGYNRLPIDFKSVDDLIQSKPELISNCVLFLGWPSPNSNSTYDYDAIKSLNPKYIVSIYECVGASGGSKFHGFLHTNIDRSNNNNSILTFSHLSETSKDDELKTMYQIDCVWKKFQEGRMCGKTIETFIILHRNDCKALILPNHVIGLEFGKTEQEFVDSILEDLIDLPKRMNSLSGYLLNLLSVLENDDDDGMNGFRIGKNLQFAA